MRYTERISENVYNTGNAIIEELKIDTKNEDKDYSLEQQKNLIIALVNKLGKLEDLEEQLGCPLEVRDRALEQGFIYNGFTKLLYICCRYDDNGYYLTNSCNKFYLKDYKQTWWLKEDKSE